jgi:hypothetical protein
VDESVLRNGTAEEHLPELATLEQLDQGGDGVTRTSEWQRWLEKAGSVNHPSLPSRRLRRPTTTWRADPQPRPAGTPTPQRASACLGGLPNLHRDQDHRGRLSITKANLKAYAWVVPWQKGCRVSCASNDHLSLLLSVRKKENLDEVGNSSRSRDQEAAWGVRNGSHALPQQVRMRLGVSLTPKRLR